MPNADQIMEALAELLAPKVAELLNSVAPATDDDGWQDEPAPEAPEPDESDPWGAPPSNRPASRSTGRTASRGSGSARQSNSRSSSSRGNSGGASRGGSSSFPASGTHEARNGAEWTFGLRDAPECEHGIPAAEVAGQGKNGRDYRAWACPYGFGKDYREKCGLFEFQ